MQYFPIDCIIFLQGFGPSPSSGILPIAISNALYPLFPYLLCFDNTLKSKSTLSVLLSVFSTNPPLPLNIIDCFCNIFSLSISFNLVNSPFDFSACLMVSLQLLLPFFRNPLYLYLADLHSSNYLIIKLFIQSN